jgi:hypothetical protein
MNTFLTFISVCRILNAITGAAFAALLLRATLPVWPVLHAIERWLAVALFIYSTNVTLFCALFWTSTASSRSLINIGFLISLAAGHRYLYFIRRDSSHER